jgi:hypothetical protein
MFLNSVCSSALLRAPRAPTLLGGSPGGLTKFAGSPVASCSDGSLVVSCRGVRGLACVFARGTVIVLLLWNSLAVKRSRGLFMRTPVVTGVPPNKGFLTPLPKPAAANALMFPWVLVTA